LTSVKARPGICPAILLCASAVKLIMNRTEFLAYREDCEDDRPKTDVVVPVVRVVVVAISAARPPRVVVVRTAAQRPPVYGQIPAKAVEEPLIAKL
jgi:hypothetical protein